MWILTIRSPSKEPFDYHLKEGKNTLGRQPGNDILVDDESASRIHAEIHCKTNLVVIQDLNSLNGTFVNRVRILKPTVLKPDDQIRIGQNTLIVSVKNDTSSNDIVEVLSGTRPLTRELLLESVDKHSVLLYEISNRLSKILDLNSVLREISGLMKVHMGADKCEVILADQFGKVKELGFPTSIVKQAIAERSVVFIADLSSHIQQMESAMLMQIRSVLCVPVILENEVAALIYLHKNNPTSRTFDQNDVQLAVAIGHQATLAIQRARLLERTRELENLAITDSLTGLTNRRQFLKVGELEFKRARRLQHPLVLMMFDIDNFKFVNDTFGHSVGDQVIKTIAGRCVKQLRGIDILARFGGDEFTIIPAETNLDGAIVVAKRLQKSVSIPIKIDQSKLEISISIGISVLTEDCPDLNALLNQADAKLLSAKKAGRNQIAY